MHEFMLDAASAVLDFNPYLRDPDCGLSERLPPQQCNRSYAHSSLVEAPVHGKPLMPVLCDASQRVPVADCAIGTERVVDFHAPL